jgi:hypothetical protein
VSSQGSEFDPCLAESSNKRGQIRRPDSPLAIPPHQPFTTLSPRFPCHAQGSALSDHHKQRSLARRGSWCLGVREGRKSVDLRREKRLGLPCGANDRSADPLFNFHLHITHNALTESRTPDWALVLQNFTYAQANRYNASSWRCHPWFMISNRVVDRDAQ